VLAASAFVLLLKCVEVYLLLESSFEPSASTFWSCVAVVWSGLSLDNLVSGWCELKKDAACFCIALFCCLVMMPTLSPLRRTLLHAGCLDSPCD
jgi:hypothetical protein